MYIKTMNSIFKRLQKRHPGKLLYFPTKISIETGNICNLSCPLCPTSDKSQSNVVKGMLSYDNFKVIFDKIKPFAKTIDLFSWGEPFLNKDLSDMIRYAKDERPDIRIFIDSNLNILTECQIDEVVRYGLDVLKVSCDGATQEIYQKYRVGGDMGEVLENMRKLIEKKRELSIGTPKIIWKYLVFKHNEFEVEKARSMADEMGVEFEASGMRIDCGKELFEKVEDSVSRDKEWIPEGTSYDNYTNLGAGKDFCEKPWKTMTINWNGDVVPCGAIYDCEKYSFGNLMEESFSQVWNGKKFVEARKIISNKIKENPDIICSVCKNNGYQFF